MNTRGAEGFFFPADKYHSGERNRCKRGKEAAVGPAIPSWAHGGVSSMISCVSVLGRELLEASYTTAHRLMIRLDP